MISISAIFDEAEASRQLGDLAKAEELLSRIVRDHPTAHAAWHSLGLIAHQSGRLDRATARMQKALSLDRGSGDLPP